MILSLVYSNIPFRCNITPVSVPGAIKPPIVNIRTIFHTIIEMDSELFAKIFFSCFSFYSVTRYTYKIFIGYKTCYLELFFRVHKTENKIQTCYTIIYKKIKMEISSSSAAAAAFSSLKYKNKKEKNGDFRKIG